MGKLIPIIIVMSSLSVLVVLMFLIYILSTTKETSPPKKEKVSIKQQEEIRREREVLYAKSGRPNEQHRQSDNSDVFDGNFLGQLITGHITEGNQQVDNDSTLYRRDLPATHQERDIGRGNEDSYTWETSARGDHSINERDHSINERDLSVSIGRRELFQEVNSYSNTNYQVYLPRSGSRPQHYSVLPEPNRSVLPESDQIALAEPNRSVLPESDQIALAESNRSPLAELNQSPYSSVMVEVPEMIQMVLPEEDEREYYEDEEEDLDSVKLTFEVEDETIVSHIVSPIYRAKCTSLCSYGDDIYVVHEEHLIHQYNRKEFNRFLSGEECKKNVIYSDVQISQIFFFANNIHVLSITGQVYSLDESSITKKEWSWIKMFYGVFDISVSRDRTLLWVQYGDHGIIYNLNFKTISKSSFHTDHRLRINTDTKNISFNKRLRTTAVGFDTYENVYDMIFDYDGTLRILEQPGRLCQANCKIYHCSV